MKIEELQEASYSGNRKISTTWYTLYDTVREKFVRDITRHGVIDLVEEGGRYVSFLRFDSEEQALKNIEDHRNFIKSEFAGDSDVMPKMLARVRKNYERLETIKVVKLSAEG